MKKLPLKSKFTLTCLTLLILLLFNNKVYAVPANAGADSIVYAGDTVRIGTTGYKNHTYRWSPATGLSDTTVARPFASPLYSTYYILTVTDPLNNVSVDTVYVGVLVRIDGGFPVHQADTNDPILAITPLVYDRYGNTYTFNDIKRGSCSPGWVTQINDWHVGRFNICLCTDSLGSNPFNSNVQDVIEQVFLDISGLIEPQQCNGDTALVNIQINAPLGMNPNVAGAASEFYIPNEEVFSLATETSGILHGRVWKAINMGINSPSLVDARIDLNFLNFNFTFNTTLSSPGSNEIDLYSVIIHEVVHTLGFASLISANGLSRLSGTDFYSKFDTNLNSDSDNEPLIEWDGLFDAQYNPFFSGSPAVLNDPICQNLLFDGLYTTAAHIAGFPQGQLSHFCTSNTLMMFPGIFTGAMRREPSAALVNILLDLGYEVTGTFPNTSGLPSGGPGPIGRHDGNAPFFGTCGGRFTLSLCNSGTDSINITATQVLSNDINANSYDGMEMLVGTGTFTDYGNSFTYIPTNPGLSVFRYIPVNTTTGERGNITYVFVEVFNCADTSCYQPDICNQICNPHIEFPGGSNCEMDLCNVPSWSLINASPDYSNSNMNQPSPGFIQMGVNSFAGTPLNESLGASVNIVQGRSYTFSYMRRVLHPNPSGYLIQHAYVRLTNETDLNAAGLPNLSFVLPATLPANQLILEEQNLWDDEWERVTVCFTANDDYDRLWIYPNSNAFNMLYVDELYLIEDNFSAGENDTITCGNVVLGTSSCTLEDITYEWTIAGSSTVIDTTPQITVNINNTTSFVVNRQYPTNPATVVFPTQDNNCNVFDTVTIVVADPLNMTLSIDSVPCIGNCNGTAQVVTVSNGTTPYFYQWDDPAEQPTAIATGLCAGTYTVTVTDSTGCMISETIDIVGINCACTDSADANVTIFNWTNSFSLSANTLYALGANVTVTGANVVLNDAAISIAPGINITINAGAILTLDHCHLYACDSMWQGIIVEPGGRLIINNGSLIEDAELAVDIQNHTSTASILEVDESVFNRNYIGINIANYQQNTATYPFEISNSVFTSRNLTFTNSTWPSPTDLETLDNIGDLDEHYDMDGYATVGRKAPNNTDQVSAGIYLDDVGTLNGGIYHSFVLDGDNGNGTFNLFDNLMFAVIGTNSNTSASNNVFQLLPRHTSWNFGGRGITLQNTNVPAQHCLIEVTGNNRFYDCVVGVDVDGYNDIFIENTNMRSSQMPVSSIPNEGEVGIYISSAYLDTLSVSFDTISNIRNGIVFFGNGIGTPPSVEQLIGPMTFSNNIIQATLDGFNGAPTDEYVLNGIIVDNTALNAATQAQAYSPILIQNNKLYQVHNGIHTQNWRYDTESYFNNKIYTTDNYISLRQIEYPNSTPQEQFGIRHELNEGGQIQNNTVDGFDNSSEEWYGIMADDLVSIGVTPSVICNTSRLTGTGIIFSQPSNIYVFQNNTMNNNQLGYVLNAADIDEQGDNTYACGNRWINYSTGFMTYTMNGADPQNSVLWIDDSDSAQDPTGFNGSDVPFFEYEISNGLEPVGSNSNNASCSAPQNRMAGNNPIQYDGITKSNSPLDSLRLIALLERMVTDSFSRFPYSDEARILAKQRAYGMIEQRPGLTNRSHILQGFSTQANLGNAVRWKIITEAVSNNRLQQANHLLSQFVPANSIEANDKAYLTAYLHYKQNIFNRTDSLELNRLVHGCVKRDGYAVAQARALYRLKFKDFNNFYDDCWNQTIPRLLDVESINVGRLFKIYPNPNAGNLSILYSLKKEEQGKLLITDITGRQIRSYQLSQEQNNLSISEAALENGVYFFSFIIDGQLISTQKVVIIR